MLLTNPMFSKLGVLRWFVSHMHPAIDVGLLAWLLSSGQALAWGLLEWLLFKWSRGMHKTLNERGGVV